MLKKGLFTGSGLLLLLALFFGRDAFSYLSTTADWISTSVEDSVPVKFELDRARNMIADLGPEISRHKREIAREELDLRKLRDKVAEDLDSQDTAWSNIQRLRDDLSSDSNFVYAGRTYTSKQVETDLSNRFERFQTREATVRNLEKILDARERGLVAAQEKLKAMMNAKRQLEVQVENLEARLKMVEVAKAASDFQIDDSQLSRTRELLADIEARIEVDAEMVNADDIVMDEIPLEEPVEDMSVLDRISQYEADRDPSAEAYTGIEIEDVE